MTNKFIKKDFYITCLGEYVFHIFWCIHYACACNCLFFWSSNTVTFFMEIFSIQTYCYIWPLFIILNLGLPLAISIIIQELFTKMNRSSKNVYRHGDIAINAID